MGLARLASDRGGSAASGMTRGPQRGWIVAILGAESTGKTTLAHQLAARLEAEGRRCCVIEETLREFCDREGRTPRIDEQAAIAAEHSRRIEAAARDHDIVIADTTALQTAVYSEKVFGDRSLYGAAGAWHAGAVVTTLLTALDLPWQADGLQRDGPQVREPVDALLRAALQRAGAPYAVIGGAGLQRAAHALAALHRTLDLGHEADDPRPASAQTKRWQWLCERCGDVDCERHLLPRR